MSQRSECITDTDFICQALKNNGEPARDVDNDVINTRGGQKALSLAILGYIFGQKRAAGLIY
jgi:hypothetical protein